MKYLILGAGPAGLSLACRLKQLGERDFLVLEKENEAGGLFGFVFAVILRKVFLIDFLEIMQLIRALQFYTFMDGKLFMHEDMGAERRSFLN